VRSLRQLTTASTWRQAGRLAFLNCPVR
jgi:hypothetical protein